MSSEVEATGAAVTAGLVAAVIDGPKARGPAGRGGCINCGAEVSGHYCSACGQPTNLHRTLLHMVEEFARGIVLFDTRAWRTLPMLFFRPGTLTNGYIRGQRARYISPMAMFLLAVFAMFMVFAFSGGSRVGVVDAGQRIESTSAGLAIAEESLTKAKARVAELAAKGATGREIEVAQLRANTLEKSLERVRASLQPLNAEGGTTGPGVDSANIYDEIREAAKNENIHIQTGWTALDKKLEEKLANPELAVYKVQNAAYKFAFLLVPISLPFVWLMFAWRRKITLFDHTVYILYSLSFASLLFIVMSLVSMAPAAMSLLGAPLVLALPVHSFFHMKGGYGLSWFSALWRLPFQLLFACISFLLFLLVILVLGFVE